MRSTMKRLAILTSLFLFAAALSAQAADTSAAPAAPPAADSTVAVPSVSPPETGETPPAPPALPAAPGAPVVPALVPASSPETAAPSAGTGSEPAATQAGSDWFWGKPIASIEWQGVVHADKRELDSATKAFIGKNFTEDLWMEIQSKVYEL